MNIKACIYLTILSASFCNAEYISPDSPSAIGDMLSYILFGSPTSKMSAKKKKMVFLFFYWRHFASSYFLIRKDRC